MAGSWNLSAHWEAGLQGSSPTVLPTAYSYDLQGGPYMLQVGDCSGRAMAAAIMILHTMMLNLTHFLEWHFDLE